MCIFCDSTPSKVREYGRIFGYPECCIDEFINDQDIRQKTGEDVRNEDQKDVARRTMGFVPCKMHTQMIVAGTITPEELVAPTRNAKKVKKLNKKALEQEEEF